MGHCIHEEIDPWISKSLKTKMGSGLEPSAVWLHSPHTLFPGIKMEQKQSKYWTKNTDKAFKFVKIWPYEND